jgi:DNA repair photolyase
MSRQATLPFVPALPALPGTAQPDPAVEVWLRRALLRKEPIVLGTDGADPYSVETLEKTEPGFVRALLQGLARLDGLEVAITTRSPRVLQDLSLLTELDQRHTVRVDIPLAAVDRELAKRIEPREPEPEARLWAVSQLASEGITTRVLVKPILPGVNDGEESLRALFEAALEAGACDVVAGAIPAARPRRLPWGPWGAGEDRSREDLLTTIRRLRLEHGFPRSTPGRG